MHKKNPHLLLTTLIISGIFISYVLQMAPSPLLTILRDEFQLFENDALLNLSVSIIFPVLIIFSLAGGVVNQHLGLKKLYSVSLAFMAAGTLMNYAVTGYVGFLAGRLIFAVGFGLGIPFIGAAIMSCYQGKAKDAMNTVNAIFPFIGTLLSFGLLIPLYRLWGNSWRASLGIWGFALIAVLLIWVVFVRQNSIDTASQQRPVQDDGIYRNLLKRREIRLLCVIFSCDYFCYSYIAVILPTFLQEQGRMTEQSAGVLAAIAFPAFGLLGCACGGILSAHQGRYKPCLVFGQLLKLFGVIIAVLGAPASIWLSIAGFAIFGLGNGLWMPAMYSIPMRLEGMTATHSGAAFALISSFGFFFGFISPSVGGWLTNHLSISAPYTEEIMSHAFGLRVSLLIFGLSNIVALLCAMRVQEGKGQREKASGMT